MAETKHYVDEAMDDMMDSLAEAAETERLRKIAEQSGICMYCGVAAKGGACEGYKCWI